jgi:hypothetical protein
MPAVSLREEVIEHSRANFARPRAKVESAIAEWMDASLAAPKIKPNNGMPERKKMGGAQAGKKGKNPKPDKQSKPAPTPPADDLPGTNDLKEAFAGINLADDTDTKNKDAQSYDEKKNLSQAPKKKRVKNTKPGANATKNHNDLADFIKQVEKE